jgi:hypothetical protein
LMAKKPKAKIKQTRYIFFRCRQIVLKEKCQN